MTMAVVGSDRADGDSNVRFTHDVEALFRGN